MVLCCVFCINKAISLLTTLVYALGTLLAGNRETNRTVFLVCLFFCLFVDITVLGHLSKMFTYSVLLQVDVKFRFIDDASHPFGTQ